MRLRYLTFIITPLFIVLLLPWINSFQGQTNQPFPLYFTYTSEELQPLYQLNSKEQMNRDELTKWDSIVQELIAKNEKKEIAPRIYAYLYTAQRDAGNISKRIKGNFEGSFDPISYQVVKLFFPQYQAESFSKDEYSETLASIVMKKVSERLKKDLAQTKPYPEKTGSQYWAGDKKPYYGITAGSWLPWYLKSGSEFRLSPPPKETTFWNEQVKVTKTAWQNRNDKQMLAIFFWAGMTPGEFFKSSEWIDITNQFMWEEQPKLSLEKILLVRSVLATTLEDAVIAVFDSKYTYWVKRPAMLDTSIKPPIKTPNHPSFPSGHSTISAAAEVVLNHFFPESKEEWHDMLEEAGLSRIWCGIHFPIDNEMGMKLGKEVGQAAIERQ